MTNVPRRRISRSLTRERLLRHSKGARAAGVHASRCWGTRQHLRRDYAEPHRPPSNGSVAQSGRTTGKTPGASEWVPQTAPNPVRTAAGSREGWTCASKSSLAQPVVTGSLRHPSGRSRLLQRGPGRPRLPEPATHLRRLRKPSHPSSLSDSGGQDLRSTLR
jgi:hypothetical protein